MERIGGWGGRLSLAWILGSFGNYGPLRSVEGTARFSNAHAKLEEAVLGSNTTSDYFGYIPLGKLLTIILATDY